MHPLANKPSNNRLGANQYAVHRGLVKNERVSLRLESTAKKVFLEAAQEAGMSLGDWILGCCTLYVQNPDKFDNSFDDWGLKKDKTYDFRLQASDKARFIVLAKEANLSLSDWILSCCKQFLADQSKPDTVTLSLKSLHKEQFTQAAQAVGLDLENWLLLAAQQLQSQGVAKSGS